MTSPVTVGRYVIFDELASGGMATVHLGRLLGPVGFARTVAVKRLHPQFARDPEFVASFLDEARIAARIAHPNVVPTVDVVATSGELFLVMEYVSGEALSTLVRAARKRGTSFPMPVVVAILLNALAGLHAAHEATDSNGDPLHLVHRDVSPQNFMVGQDGVTRVLDFGIAKATGRSQQTRTGVVKGKLPYMAPEQVQGREVDRRVDIYAAGVVLWELLAGQRCFQADNDYALMSQIFEGMKHPPSALNPAVPPALDEAVLRACALDPAVRFATAEAFAQAIEDALAPASPRQVSRLVEQLASESLAAKQTKVKEVENSSHFEPSLISEMGSQPSLSFSDAHPGTAAGFSPTRVAPVTDATSAGFDAGSLPPPPARSHAPWVAGIGAAVVLAAAAGALLAHSLRPPPAAATATAAAEPPVAQSATAATAAEPASSAGAVASAASEPAAPAASASAAPAATAPGTPKKTAAPSTAAVRASDAKPASPPGPRPASTLFDSRR